MRRWVNPEIALGFALGFLTLLFFIGILSYQAEHCSEVNSHAETKPAQDKLRPNPENAEDRNGEESSYNDSHPIACGAIGLPSAIIGYMDKNEGFFVGLFTFGLFLATIFLWITTNNLWRAGEKQIDVWKETAETAKRSADAFIQANAISRAQVRAFVSVPESPASELLESDGGNFILRLNIANNGGSLARHIQIICQMQFVLNLRFPIPSTTSITFGNDMIVNSTATKEFTCNFGPNHSSHMYKCRGTLLRVIGNIHYITIFDEPITETFSLVLHCNETTNFSTFVPLRKANPLGL